MKKKLKQQVREFFQGNNFGVKGTDTIYFITRSEIPQG